ncbi:hypothetical protein [Streptomyces sp. NPDC006355]|uniref:rhamnogalacturonan lyase family protein n=1 Tax=Streptomyces sp. NPDC006355 TaxID=3156758 RepID=UPI0033BC5719
MGDLDLPRPGLEEFKVDEDSSKPAFWMADARTGQVLWSAPAGGDNGRGVSGDIWSGSAGAESWSSLVSGVRNPKGAVVASRKSGPATACVVGRRHYARTPRRHRHRQVRRLRATPACSPAPGSTPTTAPSTPSLSGDILGDRREEVIWPTSDNTALRIYSTPYQTKTRITTILHDTQYRTALAWQNTAYNQPPAPQLLHRRQHAYATPPHRRAAEQSLSWTAVCQRVPFLLGQTQCVGHGGHHLGRHGFAVACSRRA